MDQQLLKVTFHHSSEKKMSTYLTMPYAQKSLQQNIEAYLFNERKLPRCEIRLYWIDNDGDEIDMVNEKDFEIFLDKCQKTLHVHVSPIVVDTSKHPTNDSPMSTEIPPAADDMDENRVHLSVECDSCLMAPIVGFRYKCIQCPNYDLCQNCEAKHVHSEHMMVRMPNNGCPYVIDAFVTNGRKASRKHEKRCKSGESARFPCGFAYASAASGPSGAASGSGEKTSESADASGKERHHHGRKHRRHVRHNFLSHLYEMMHDLAEGGGPAAAAAAMGTDGATTTEGGSNKEADAAAKAAAAAENAKEVAAKAAEIAAKVAHQASLSASAAVFGTGPTVEASTHNKSNNGRDGPASSTQSAQQPSTTEPVIPSPSLENLAQFLNPEYMKTGIEILNNFSDMFAKMLDPVEGNDSPSTSSCPFDSTMRKSSSASVQSSNSKKSHDSIKTNVSEKAQEGDVTKAPDSTQGENDKISANSLVDIMDLGSDSESDGVSEGFVKLNAPNKENTPEKAKDTLNSSSSDSSASTSKGSTPSTNSKSANVMDYKQLSADLKAHIAKEQQKEEEKAVAPEPVRELRAVPVFRKENSTNTESVTEEPKKPEAEINIPIYHSDVRINSAVLKMMSMGFSNEGAMLTQLLESVNGNINEAIDLILNSQRNM